MRECAGLCLALNVLLRCSDQIATPDQACKWLGWAPTGPPFFYRLSDCVRHLFWWGNSFSTFSPVLTFSPLWKRTSKTNPRFSPGFPPFHPPWKPMGLVIVQLLTPLDVFFWDSSHCAPFFEPGAFLSVCTPSQSFVTPYVVTAVFNLVLRWALRSKLGN